KDSDPRVRRAALTALDQMAYGKLSAAAVRAELEANDPRLQETAWWIASRHPEWGGAFSESLRVRLTAPQWSANERERFVTLLAQLARSKAIETLLARQLLDEETVKEARLRAMQAMARSGLKIAPQAWFDGLHHALTSADPDLTREAAAAARAIGWPKARPQEVIAALQQLGADSKGATQTRLLALAALPDGIAKPEPGVFAFLLREVDAEKPAATRGFAAEVLSRAHLDNSQLLELTQKIAKIGPMEIDRVLDAFTHSTDEAVGQKLLAALKSSAARTSLRPDALKSRLTKYGPEIRKEAEALIASLHADAAKRRAYLHDTL